MLVGFEFKYCKGTELYIGRNCALREIGVIGRVGIDLCFKAEARMLVHFCAALAVDIVKKVSTVKLDAGKVGINL